MLRFKEYLDEVKMSISDIFNKATSSKTEDQMASDRKERKDLDWDLDTKNAARIKRKQENSLSKKIR